MINMRGNDESSVQGRWMKEILALSIVNNEYWEQIIQRSKHNQEILYCMNSKQVVVSKIYLKERSIPI